MKLIIFSPIVITSAIGRVSILILNALVEQGHDVIIIRTETSAHFEEPHFLQGTQFINWDNSHQVEQVIKDADAIIYQIGDNYQFHCGALEWLPKLPGIVCLHDYFLGHLFNAWAETRRKIAHQILESFYGKALANNHFTSTNEQDFINLTWQTTPMTEWIASMASAVITHSSWDIQRVLNACPGPVYVVPLAYNKPELEFKESNLVDENNAYFDILTFGHINLNKRTKSVIQAIGNSKILREKVRYQLAGSITPEISSELTNFANECKVKFSILGTVSDIELDSLLKKAKIVCCLRKPTLEAASASTIEAMLYKKCVIVIDTGFYHELPTHCVRKILPTNEITDLQNELEFLYLNQEVCFKIGQNAADWALKTFNKQNYAQKLIELCLAAARTKPIIDASRFFIEVLQRWNTNNIDLIMQDSISQLRIFESS